MHNRCRKRKKHLITRNWLCIQNIIAKSFNIKLLKMFKLACTLFIVLSVVEQFMINPVSAHNCDGNSIDIDIVPCSDQQEACICKENAKSCQFRLDIEELQTLTSYKMNIDGELVSRGTLGDTYYITPTGYSASIPSSCAMIPERGPCWNSTDLGSDADFINMGCSIPMMVDGHSHRPYISVNGRIPGPTLIVHEDQYVIVDVFNHLSSEGVTIHWHGIHQKNTPWMDGVAAVSQAPIVPGGRFRYIFVASPSGTHWYHSHLGAQRSDGLFGALIVHEKEETMNDIIADVSQRMPGHRLFIDLPEVYTMTLLDWQREASIDLFVKLHSTLGFCPQNDSTRVPQQKFNNSHYFPRAVSTDGAEVGPVPYWSGLINGRGRYSPNDYGNLSVFTVNPSMSIRFRLIGAQSLYAYKFEIEDHKLRILATDGQIVHLSEEVDYIIVHSGERYDFILDTKENIPDGAENYWIRAETLENITVDGRQNHSAEAILHYTCGASKASDLNPFTRYNNVTSIPRQCTQRSMCSAFNCPFLEFPSSYNTRCIAVSQLRNRFSTDLPKVDNMDSNRLKFFNFGFEGESSTSAINGRHFLPPSTPYQTYPGEYGRDVEDGLTCQQCNSDTTTASQPNQCTCTYVEKIVSGYKLSDSEDKSVMMVLSALGLGTNRYFSHPVHLHGHSFYVIDFEYGTYEDGVLLNDSMDIVCDSSLCTNPRWRNGTPSPVTVAMASNEKLIDTAVRKDTVIVPAGGYVVIAFIADSPGYWFMHCLIEVHQLEGMAVIIQEYDESEHNYNFPPDINKPGKLNWTTNDLINFTNLYFSGCIRIRILAVIEYFVIIFVILGLILQ